MILEEVWLEYHKTSPDQLCFTKPVPTDISVNTEGIIDHRNQLSFLFCQIFWLSSRNIYCNANFYCQCFHSFGPKLRGGGGEVEVFEEGVNGLQEWASLFWKKLRYI